MLITSSAVVLTLVLAIGLHSAWQDGYFARREREAKAADVAASEQRQREVAEAERDRAAAEQAKRHSDTEAHAQALAEAREMTPSAATDSELRLWVTSMQSQVNGCLKALANSVAGVDWNDIRISRDRATYASVYSQECNQLPPPGLSSRALHVTDPSVRAQWLVLNRRAAMVFATCELTLDASQRLITVIGKGDSGNAVESAANIRDQRDKWARSVEATLSECRSATASFQAE